MKVHHIIQKHIVTTHPGATFRELWKVIFQKRINAIPVVDKKSILIGIVTKEDILQKLYPDFQEFMSNIDSLKDFEEMEQKINELGNLKAKDIMQGKVIFTRHDTPIMRALSRMIVHSVNQLPVLDEKDMVIGMVTKGDIFYALFSRQLTREHGLDVSHTRPAKAKRRK